MESLEIIMGHTLETKDFSGQAAPYSHVNQSGLVNVWLFDAIQELVTDYIKALASAKKAWNSLPLPLQQVECPPRSGERIWPR